MPAANAGSPFTLTLNFFNQQSGSLVDPVSVQLDITYGEEIGFAADVAGPFIYSGASVPTTNQVYRVSTGVYAFLWQIPPKVSTGVYVANWSVVYGANTYLVFENFPVLNAGLVPLPVPSGDIGYWTGSLAYATAGVTVNFGATDSNGITWLWNKIQGWDGVDTSGGVIQRSGDHGAWPSPQFYQARTLTLTVTASAPTQSLRDLARENLQQVIPISDLATLTYNEPVPKQIAVRRSGKLTESYPTLTDVTFTCGLVAPDPRKYGTIAKTLTTVATPLPPTGTLLTVPFTVPFTLVASPPLPGTTVAVLNAGNFETRPSITINGPIIGPQLTNVTTGQTVSYSAISLGPADSLVVDFNVRQATLDNATFVPADPFSAWWTLQPGTTTVRLAGTFNTGSSLTVAWQDSYL
jgi:Siphovirus-type tail component, C-terminal domain